MGSLTEMVTVMSSDILVMYDCYVLTCKCQRHFSYSSVLCLLMQKQDRKPELFNVYKILDERLHDCGLRRRFYGSPGLEFNTENPK